MAQKELARAATHGDAAASPELYTQLSPAMSPFAYYMLKHAEDAKDAVGDAVMDAWAAIGTLKKEESFKSWIFTILSNKCKAKMREYVNRPGELTEELEDTLQAAEGVTAPEH